MKWYMYRGPFYAILSRFRVVLLGLKGIGEMLGQSSSSSTSTGSTCTQDTNWDSISTQQEMPRDTRLFVYTVPS